MTVLLPTGRRRSVPRSATNLERPVEESSYDLHLPVISVPTILPLARFVQGLGAWQRRKAMRSKQRPASNHQSSVLPSLWYRLPTSSQQQLAHLVAELMEPRPNSRKRQGA
ncbi:MAG: hypothetical protein E6I91_15915 [Chloroflexi bacterium]|nr:MAG: hypothetical protein E6I91_15915 [Chloroflexota bacterium]